MRARAWTGLAVLASCGGGSDGSLRFVDVSSSTGIDFVSTSGGTPSTQILEVKGGGVALLDFDGDGDLDVFIPNGATLASPERGPGCRLYENLGGLAFRDATQDAGLTFDRWGYGVAVGDFDGDDDDDLYVTCFGPNALLRNDGGRFVEVTETAGVGCEAWSVAAAFGDLDGDGDLDLYVANYLRFDVDHPPPISSFKSAPVFRGPIGLEPEPDVLYENLGDGTFAEIAERAGCRTVDAGYGLGAVILDFDGDGRQDVFVGNDSTPNFLFVNQGQLRFEERAIDNGLSVNVDGSPQSTMGIGIADVDGDGLPDLFTTNFSNDTNTLHVSKGQGRFFDDETRRYGLGMLAFAHVGWACGFYDLDHDGDEDLMLFNGHVYPNASVEVMDADYAQPPLLFEREAGRFMVAEDAGDWLASAHRDRGAVWGDLDGDGDVDVIVSELNGPLRVLRNDGAGPCWLIVELEPSALGSKVVLEHASARQTRWIYSGGGFASASAQVAHFGLPAGTGEIDVVVTWPDGHEQRVDGVAPSQRLRVRRE